MYPPASARIRGARSAAMAADDVILDIVASHPMDSLPRISQGGSRSSTSSTAADGLIDAQPAQSHARSQEHPHHQYPQEQYATERSSRKQSSNASDLRQVFRIDRDYTAGEICQFSSRFPLEMEGRVSPTAHLKVMNELNALLADALDPYKSIFDNVVAVLSLYLSTLLRSTHYERGLKKFEAALASANCRLYKPVGMHMCDPRKNAYLFLEVEYE